MKNNFFELSFKQIKKFSFYFIALSLLNFTVVFSNTSPKEIKPSKTASNQYFKIHNYFHQAELNINQKRFEKSNLYLQLALEELNHHKKFSTPALLNSSTLLKGYNRLYISYNLLYQKELEEHKSPIKWTKKMAQEWIEKTLHKDTLKQYGLQIPNPVPKKIKQHLIRFLTVERKTFSIYLKRLTYFQEFIEEQLIENKLPKDLVFVAMIESGFNTKAYSHAKASGLWQFIPSTGKFFGLDKNWWMDERRDPQKSTQAAIQYLKKLYQKLNSWDLALASYNAGEQKIYRQIRRKKHRNYWKMDLPKETQNYVGRILAAMIIGRNPQVYGFPAFAANKKFNQHDTVAVKYAIDLDFIAKHTGSNIKVIQTLNPEIKRWTTPPNVVDYQIRIPKGTKREFLEKYQELEANQFTNWVRHKIRKGETLGQIAQRYQVPIREIKKTNQLSSHIISIGQYLVIPKKVL